MVTIKKCIEGGLHTNPHELLLDLHLYRDLHEWYLVAIWPVPSGGYILLIQTNIREPLGLGEFPWLLYVHWGWGISFNLPKM